MFRLGKQEEVEKYFEAIGASQSYLKALINGVSFLETGEKERYYEEKGNLIIGSAVDCILTQGMESFKEQYFKSEIEKPSDTIKSMVQLIFDNACVMANGEAPEDTIHAFERLTLDAIEYHKYQKNWKTETRINKVWEAGFDYFEDLKNSHGKQILSDIESTIIENIVMSLKSHGYTRQYFEDRNKHIFYQVPIYFSYMGVDCKVLLDMCIVDPIERTIQPLDLKTMADFTIEFPRSLKRFKYNFQGSFYTQGLEALLKSPDQVDTLIELKEVVNENFTILPFKFMVETTKYKTNKLTGETKFYQGSPLMYTLSKEQLDLGKYGRPKLTVPTHVRFEEDLGPLHPVTYEPIIGFEGALDLYKWHMEHGFDVDKEVHESNGDLVI